MVNSCDEIDILPQALDTNRVLQNYLAGATIARDFGDHTAQEGL
jgi:hypothetical protein